MSSVIVRGGSAHALDDSANAHGPDAHALPSNPRRYLLGSLQLTWSGSRWEPHEWDVLSSYIHNHCRWAGATYYVRVHRRIPEGTLAPGMHRQDKYYLHGRIANGGTSFHISFYGYLLKIIQLLQLIAPTTPIRIPYSHIPGTHRAYERGLIEMMRFRMRRHRSPTGLVHIQVPGLDVHLLPHQSESLSRMLAMEDEPCNPWVPINSSFHFCPMLIRFMNAQTLPPPIRGGFLFDEMGLGKTVTSLAVVTMRPPQWLLTTGSLPRGGTLVVCPVALVGQWVNEARRWIRDEAVRIYVHHGPRRHHDPMQIAGDIVVTTYGIVASDVAQSRGVAGMQWWRVIFDESHVARNRDTMRHKACLRLRATRRWAVTGTPICTRAGHDIASQFALIAPAYASMAQSFSVHGLYDMGGALASTFGIRHEKAHLPPGWLDLPPLVISNRCLPLDSVAGDAYARHLRHARRQIAHSGRLQLHSTVRHLVQACAIGFEQRTVVVPEETFGFASVVDGGARVEQKHDENCAICLDVPEDPCRTTCGHIFCAECLNAYFNTRRTPTIECPLCRRCLHRSDIVVNDKPAHHQQLPAISSPKIAELFRIFEETDEKILVFSQFSYVLRAVAERCTQNQVSHRCVFGPMSQKSYAKQIDEFSRIDNVRALLVSTRSCATGLNLTAASTVVFLDPLLIQATESQCIARAWRVGQRSRVRVIRIVLERTIDQHILNKREHVSLWNHHHLKTLLSPNE